MKKKPKKPRILVCQACNEEFVSKPVDRNSIGNKPAYFKYCRRCHTNICQFNSTIEALADYLRCDPKKVSSALKCEGWNAPYGDIFLQDLSIEWLSCVISEYKLGKCRNPQKAFEILQKLSASERR